MKRICIFLMEVVLPALIAAMLLLVFHPVYRTDGQLNYLLLWVCVGFPFGIRRMFLWLVPHQFDLAGTVGVFALDLLLGGIIGGLVLLMQVVKGMIHTVTYKN